MSRKDSIDSLFLNKPASRPASVSATTDRVRTGAISAMGSSLQEMAEGAKQAAKLQQQLVEGEVVIAIDPAKIEKSKVADRIPIDVDLDFDGLVKSIEEHGQHVPILVRPHPDKTGQYQIAYGRRRLRAAERLGRQVRAIVKSLTDEQLYIAQGRENLDRKDLSFIEKAFFAKNLEDSGCDRATIISALASDKGDVSRYIGVARQVPEDVVQLIGPAPKAGRAKWLALAGLLSDSSNLATARTLLTEFKQALLDSDSRLEGTLRGLTVSGSVTKREPAMTWSTPSGAAGARIDTKDGKTAIVFEEKIVPAFAKFVSDKLDALYEEYRRDNEGGATK